MHLPVIESARPGTRPAATGAVLVVASALALALDGPVARAAYQHGLDPAASQLLGAALLVGAGLTVQLAPALSAARTRSQEVQAGQRDRLGGSDR